VRRSQRAFFHDGPVGSLHAITDTFLVYIESDIVVDVHWVLLFQVSEPVVNTRSRHCSLQENPSSFRSLYIQTCGILGNSPAPASGLRPGESNPVFTEHSQQAMRLETFGRAEATRNIRTESGVSRSMALTDEEKQRIREEEMVRLMAREEYQSKRRQRAPAPIAIVATC